MIQIYTTRDDGKRICIFGVTKGNIERLTAGKPLILRTWQPVDESYVVYGEDKPAILRQLKDAGMEVLDAHMAAATADPL